MNITVKLFATFREYLPMEAVNGSFPVELEEKRTVQELLQTLRLPEEMPRVVLVNGRQAEDSVELHAGDTVSVFPPLAGGRASFRGEPPQAIRFPMEMRLVDD